ncbi:hypothetical protein [Guptibacillus sedimenti]|uniref:hypothetical protein n=1 Tax=Guptibacillus sedimenti TaxID=3025680 RepID=UPI00235F8D47|nr:hypothetical protein [Pseudalkalibacillus sedimenti]
MSATLLFHRILDQELYEKLGVIKQPFTASYFNGEDEVDMKVEPLEGQNTIYQIVDPKVTWEPSSHEIKLNKRITITNPGFLFGDNSLVADNGCLGIGLRWYSRDAAQRNVTHATEFSKLSNFPLEVEVSTSIERGLLRGNVTFEIFVYLLESGTNTSTVKPGTMLGTLDECVIAFDGNSSVFPIVEVNEPNKPLWWVDCNFTEPLFDSFTEDNVAIVINNSHRNAKKLDLEKGIGSSPLLLEVIATGLQMIIEKVKESDDWESILVNKDTEPGSIGEAIYYFIDSFNWDPSSPEILAKSIRLDFDSKFK